MSISKIDESHCFFSQKSYLTPIFSRFRTIFSLMIFHSENVYFITEYNIRFDSVINNKSSKKQGIHVVCIFIWNGFI